MSKSEFSKAVQVGNVTFIYNCNLYPRMLVVESCSTEGGAYKPEKVIQINGEWEIWKLKDFFNDVCSTIVVYEETDY